MRALMVACLLMFTVHTADARRPAGKRAHASKGHRHDHARKRVAVREDHDGAKASRSQSFGLPWAGELRGATRLRLGDGAIIRRPYRAFGTRTTVELLRRAITDTIESHPKAHVLAIGDLSAEHGGAVSDHHSHQSGRDVDLGLFYKHKPAGYPDSFIAGTDDNLDCASTFALLSNLVRTAHKDGGVQVIFLDYDVQGVLVRWAKDHDISDKRLDAMFQYPHGRDSNEGVIRHYRNHANHLHVRFQCAATDSGCR